MTDIPATPRRRRATTRTEAERFWQFVLKGPAAGDCWLWTGAIADDGYGRFWTAGVDGKQKIVRPQRYAYTALTGRELTPDVLILHRCDVPLCVHADVDPEASHLRPGDTSDNMQDRARRGRQPRPSATLRFRDLPRAERARRSRALRVAVLERGWDAAAIHGVLSGVDPEHPTLF